jgi:hypothetical protein
MRLWKERSGPVSIAAQRLGLVLAVGCMGGVEASAQAFQSDADLKTFAVHINRTPQQPWPGYGIYLGNGLILTASHVPGNMTATKPRVAIAGQDLPASPIKEGTLETVDLTLMSVDATKLPIRLQMVRMPLCEKPPFDGEAVVVAVPEGTARSRVLPTSAIPLDLRDRFGTVIGDVATTGNSGSGVFDAWKQCLLGVISRKITVRALSTRPGEPPRTKDIAKYFVPVGDIKTFLPKGVSF